MSARCWARYQTIQSESFWQYFKSDEKIYKNYTFINVIYTSFTFGNINTNGLHKTEEPW